MRIKMFILTMLSAALLYASGTSSAPPRHMPAASDGSDGVATYPLQTPQGVLATVYAGLTQTAIAHQPSPTPTP